MREMADLGGCRCIRWNNPGPRCKLWCRWCGRCSLGREDATVWSKGKPHAHQYVSASGAAAHAHKRWTILDTLLKELMRAVDSYADARSSFRSLSDSEKASRLERVHSAAMQLVVETANTESAGGGPTAADYKKKVKEVTWKVLFELDQQVAQLRSSSAQSTSKKGSSGEGLARRLARVRQSLYPPLADVQLCVQHNSTILLRNKDPILNDQVINKLLSEIAVESGRQRGSRRLIVMEKACDDGPIAESAIEMTGNYGVNKLSTRKVDDTGDDTEAKTLARLERRNPMNETVGYHSPATSNDAEFFLLTQEAPLPLNVNFSQIGAKVLAMHGGAPAGMKIGDKLVSINNTRVKAEVTAAELACMLKASQMPLRLLILRDKVNPHVRQNQTRERSSAQPSEANEREASKAADAILQARNALELVAYTPSAEATIDGKPDDSPLSRGRRSLHGSSVGWLRSGQQGPPTPAGVAGNMRRRHAQELTRANAELADRVSTVEAENDKLRRQIAQLDKALPMVVEQNR